MANVIINPRIIRQLGDELIESELIAISEIIKNAYDADSDFCEVNFFGDVDDDGDYIVSSIVIMDNGTGMSKEVLEKEWLHIGTTVKKQLVEKHIKTKKHKRLPIGEKGIGRFGFVKLGDYLEIITKYEDNKPNKLIIDWSEFDRVNQINKVNFEVKEHNDGFDFVSGTKFTVKSLRKKTWKKREIMELLYEAKSFQQPYKESSFKVYISFDGVNLEDELDDENKIDLSLDELIQNSMFRANFKISEEDNSIIMNYSFVPYEKMKLISSRKHDICTDIRIVEKGNKIDPFLDLSGWNIGSFEIDWFGFHLSTGTLELITKEYVKKNIKTSLKKIGGVKVFRDSNRVYNYGSPGNDWLKIDQKRVGRIGGSLSNNVLMGYISLDRELSKGLIEKTNREGFIKNEDYIIFEGIVQYCYKLFSIQVKSDKEQIRKLYDKTYGNETFEDKIMLIEDEINISKMRQNQKIKTINLLENLRKDYNEFVDHTFKAAGNGRIYSIAVHEIEKKVKELDQTIKSKGEYEQVELIVKDLIEILDLHLSLLKRVKPEKIAIGRFLTKVGKLYKYKFERHNVEYSFSGNLEINVNVTRNLLEAAIINIAENSVYWFEYYNIKNKQIKAFVKTEEKMVKIYIVDNGNGFDMPANSMVKAYSTSKPGGTGIGLYFANFVMEQHNGTLEFLFKGDDRLNEFSDINFIPSACVLLQLPIEGDNHA